jgi:hypothetical protein
MWYTDESRTNASTGAEYCTSEVQREVMKITFCSNTVKSEDESAV